MKIDTHILMYISFSQDPFKDAKKLLHTIRLKKSKEQTDDPQVCLVYGTAKYCRNTQRLSTMFMVQYQVCQRAFVVFYRIFFCFQWMSVFAHTLKKFKSCKCYSF